MTAIDCPLSSVPESDLDWLILADWLEEHDDPRRAELLRLHRRLLETCCAPEVDPEREHQQARLQALLAEGVRPCVPQQAISLGKRVVLTFSFIPPGSFLMGSPASEPERSDDETQHKVTLTKGYYLGIHQVTQAQWQAVMGANPSNFKGANRPVENVSWDDCQEFCQKLSATTGKRFRLPTEAEWERACRAGTTTPFHFGETISTEQANYDGNYTYGKGKKGKYRQETMPVGIFPANAWGLYDMHGNVWEWCSDWYAADFGDSAKGKQSDPINEKASSARVLRGGSWGSNGWICRSAFRSGLEPDARYQYIGFRVAAEF